jgi:hypothetical protein
LKYIFFQEVIPLKSKILKRTAAIITIIATIAAISCYPVYASSTTVTGSGSITGDSMTATGTITPLTVSVTHTINMSYSIDPNSGTITAPPITITNNTKVPVTVAVQSIASTSGGTLTFTDVLPTAESWPNLDCTDSKKYIALGVQIANGLGWNAGYSSATDWAAADTPTTFGSIASNASASLQLVADTGSAFDSSYTANCAITIVVNLA